MANHSNGDGIPSRNLSQFDAPQTLRLGFDDDLQAFRHFNIECPIYDRFETTLDVDGNMTKIVYYAGVTNEVTEFTFTDDVSGSLNNLYIVLSSSYDKEVFYIWYNVDGGGTDPAIANATGIEIPLVSNDTAKIVATATYKYSKLNNEFFYLFNIDYNNNNKITFSNNRKGPTTLTSSGTSPFTLDVKKEGTEEITAIVKLEYTDGNLTEFYKI